MLVHMGPTPTKGTLLTERPLFSKQSAGLFGNSLLAEVYALWSVSAAATAERLV